MKGVLSGGKMVWVDKVPGGNQIGGIMCGTRQMCVYVIKLAIIRGAKGRFMYLIL